MLPQNRKRARAQGAPILPAPEPASPTAPRRWKRARFLLGIVIAVAVSSVLALSARRHIARSKRFEVREVVVAGASHHKADDIVRLSEVSIGQNIFLVELDRARAKLLSDPWVVDASLVRKLPGVIAIEVKEREPGALVSLGEMVLASREGEIFKKLEPSDPTNLPLITGLHAREWAQDKEGMTRAVRRGIDLASEYERMGLAAKAELQQVHYAENGALSIVVGKHPMTLVLGEPPFRRKLEQGAKVLSEIERRGAKADVVLLDNDAHPERVVVRMR